MDFEERVKYEDLYGTTDAYGPSSDECGCPRCRPLVVEGDYYDGDCYWDEEHVPEASNEDAVNGNTTQGDDQDDEETDNEYLITATVQFVVKSEFESWAMGMAKDRLNEFIADGYAPNDPLNGAVLESVQKLGV